MVSFLTLKKKNTVFFPQTILSMENDTFENQALIKNLRFSIEMKPKCSVREFALEKGQLKCVILIIY